MSKVGKAYKRTDELTALTSTSKEDIIAIYTPSLNEEFQIDTATFLSQILNPTTNAIPVRNGTEFVDSPFTVVYDAEGVATDIISAVPVTVPSGTLSLGGLLVGGEEIQRGVTEIKDAGNSILAVNNVTGDLGITPLAQLIKDPNSPFGVGRVRSPQGAPFQFGNFGGTDTSTLTFDGDRRVMFDVITQSSSYITAFIFKGITGRVHFDVIDTTCADGEDSLVYTSSQGFPIDFGAADINNNILYEAENPFFLSKDNLLRVEFYSADGGRVEIRGQTLDPIPPTGDIMSFIPFFEIQASTVTERIIFHNDRVTDVNSDFNILGSFVHAVDTTAAPVTLTANPDVTRFFDVIDAEANFGANSCMVDLQVDNVRSFPNDFITSVDAKSFTATLVDTGASGVSNVLSEGGTPKFYHDGTDWVVQTDADMLTFKDVENRSGFVWFRIIGVDAALTVGNQTQLIEDFSGKKVVFDKIGSASDTVESLKGLKAIDELGSVVFDDKVTETMHTLDETSKSYTFWYDGVTWSKFEKGIPEAPEDGTSYVRKDGGWVSETTGGSVDSVFGRTGAVVAQNSDYDADQVDYDNTTSGLAATDVQDAIDEVAANTGDLGYVLATWGANLQNTGRFPRINGVANMSEVGGLGIDASAPVPADGTIDTLTYYMDTGDNTTVFKIIKNGVVAHTFTCAAPYGQETGIGLPVALGDNIAIEYDAGMKPAGGLYSVYIK